MVQDRIRKLLISLFVVFLLVPGLAPAVLGQDAASTPTVDPNAPVKAFEFYPSKTGLGSIFEATIKPGKSAKMVGTIGNTGNVDQEIRMYALNAFTKDGGGFGMAPYGEPPNEVTSWVDLPEETYTIKPGTGIERTFEVNVPKGTAPGQYITAVTAEEANSTEVEGSNMFTQRLRYVVPVFITVPGDMTTSFEVGPITLTNELDITTIQVVLNNTGDIRVRPEGSVNVLDADGKLVIAFPVKMESIYARESTTLTVGAAGASQLLEPTKVQVNLADPDTGETASGEQSGFVVDTSATPVPVLISITSATATPKPAADNVQFVQVEATIQNSGDPVANAQLSLVASKDGAEVERFPISQSLSLPTGDTPISTRYLPADGWTTGTWTFELLLESVDPSGAAVVLGRLPVDGTVTIP